MRKWRLATLMAVAPLVGVHAAEPDAPPVWTATADGAVVLTSGSDEQYQGSFSIIRNLNGGHIGLTVSRADTGRSAGIINAVPAQSNQIGVSGGVRAGDWTLDAYASLGRRHFGRELIGPNGMRAQSRASGDSFGAGLSLSHTHALADDQWLVPYMAADHFQVDIARTVTLAAGPVSVVKENNRGTSLTLGSSWQSLWGSGGQHGIAPYCALVISSDNSAFSPGTGGAALARLLAVRGGGVSDVWGEAGANASLHVAPSLSLTMGAARTFGFAGPEAVTLEAGLGLDF